MSTTSVGCSEMDDCQKVRVEPQCPYMDVMLPSLAFLRLKDSDMACLENGQSVYSQLSFLCRIQSHGKRREIWKGRDRSLGFSVTGYKP